MKVSLFTRGPWPLGRITMRLMMGALGPPVSALVLESLETKSHSGVQSTMDPITVLDTKA